MEGRMRRALHFSPRGARAAVAFTASRVVAVPQVWEGVPRPRESRAGCGSLDQASVLEVPARP